MDVVIISDGSCCGTGHLWLGYDKDIKVMHIRLCLHGYYRCGFYFFLFDSKNCMHAYMPLASYIPTVWLLTACHIKYTVGIVVAIIFPVYLYSEVYITGIWCHMNHGDRLT